MKDSSVVLYCNVMLFSLIDSCMLKMNKHSNQIFLRVCCYGAGHHWRNRYLDLDLGPVS